MQAAEAVQQLDKGTLHNATARDSTAQMTVRIRAHSVLMLNPELQVASLSTQFKEGSNLQILCGLLLVGFNYRNLGS